jgi:drug/metabolite transporter (DMT)-like permease
VPLNAFAIVMAAAVVHALWNLLIAGSKDTQATTALAIAVGVVVVLPFAVVRWDVKPEVWPFVVASSVLELVYFWLLTTAYNRAEMSLTYPIARGAAPVIVLLVSILFLGVPTTIIQASGIGLVAVGVVLVRGVRGGAKWSDVALALVIGSTIAGYSLVDNQGVRYADPVTYITLILILPAIVGPLYIASRGGVARLRRAANWRTVAGGVGTMAAYTLVLFAFRLAGAPSVAAVREVGVVFATIGGAVFLHEKVGPSRLAGSVVVAVGIALVVLG